MPDGSVAECYAKTIADDLRLRGVAYRDGFSAHYFHPERLDQPIKVRTQNAGIFTVSMGDLFAHRVPAEHIEAVLGVMRKSEWHTYFTLSKYPNGLPRWNPFPRNAFVGVSIPADNGGSAFARKRQLYSFLARLSEVKASVRWVSIEPLFWDVGEAMWQYVSAVGALPIEWAVIGAASVRRRKSQPESRWVQRLLGLFDELRIPVYFKSNLVWAFGRYRRDFPVWNPVARAPGKKAQQRRLM